tara:strand:- start:1442 stop:1819 length:378 start_codon:yes stop_codon:yes gene_type:complete
MMRNYKNNHKRGRFRNNGDRNFRRNGSHQKLNTDFSNSSDFRRRNPGKNNQNASKLIEKYTELAREALSNGDKILSENYLQHADHFGRIFEQQNGNKIIEKNDDKQVKDVAQTEVSSDKDLSNTA